MLFSNVGDVFLFAMQYFLFQLVYDKSFDYIDRKSKKYWSNYSLMDIIQTAPIRNSNFCGDCMCVLHAMDHHNQQEDAYKNKKFL